jgi:hypothetical protein
MIFVDVYSWSSYIRVWVLTECLTAVHGAEAEQCQTGAFLPTGRTSHNGR